MLEDRRENSPFGKSAVLLRETWICKFSTLRDVTIFLCIFKVAEQVSPQHIISSNIWGKIKTCS